MKDAFIAADFGGGSGRIIAASVCGGKLELDEIHRFRNRQIQLGRHLYWDFLSLFQDMKEGLHKAVEKGYRLKSIGVDTWGVDFGFIDADGNLLGNPLCYRDPAAEGCADRYFKDNNPGEHYAEAGIQIMDINTLYRLVDLKEDSPALLSAADRLLFMPDLFCYFLTGKACNEYTIASTSELIDARTRTWNRSLIEKAGLPQRLFGEIVMPGQTRGNMTESIRQELGIDYDVPVIAVGSHDTASAVHSVNGNYDNDRSAFLSSGTWSLLGVNLSQPVLTEEARTGGFTNEGGVGGRIRFLQNITGLWILQQLIAQWESEGKPTDYPFLLSEAEKSLMESVIDVDDPVFAKPSKMDNTVRAYCLDKGMEAPLTQGDTVRIVLRSLAARYKKGIDLLNSMLPAPVERLEILGGGSRNALLNRMTEEATGIPVTTGHVEATAIGNVLVQMEAAGIKCDAMCFSNQ